MITLQKVLVLKALAFYKLSRMEEALKILEQALDLTTPGGWIRPFIESGPSTFHMLTRLKKRNISADVTDKILTTFSLSPGRPVSLSLSPPVP